jgi:hypothetical protein
LPEYVVGVHAWLASLGDTWRWNIAAVADLVAVALLARPALIEASVARY